MTISEAITLIEAGKPTSPKPALWADLGCGSGLFSRALASLLPAGSKIIGIDQEQQFKETFINRVDLEFIQADFNQFNFGNIFYDGFMLANSIHYIQDKETLLQDLKEQLKIDGTLLLVEYDTTKSNPWVPYPISFANLVRLGHSLGFSYAQKLGERNSRYGSQKMYACKLKMTKL